MHICCGAVRQHRARISSRGGETEVCVVGGRGGLRISAAEGACHQQQRGHDVSGVTCASIMREALATLPHLHCVCVRLCVCACVSVSQSVSVISRASLTQRREEKSVNPMLPCMLDSDHVSALHLTHLSLSPPPLPYPTNTSSSADFLPYAPFPNDES